MGNKLMKSFINQITALFMMLILSGCGDANEGWRCETQGSTMFSMNNSGELGSAGKGCSCNQIRNHELKHFGTVDEEALKSDFNC